MRRTRHEPSAPTGRDLAAHTGHDTAARTRHDALLRARACPRPTRHVPALSLATLAALAVMAMALAAPAAAVDGVPVFESGGAFGTQFDGFSQVQPDACGKFLAFVATPLPAGRTTHDSRVWVANLATGESWPVRPGAWPSPVPGEQAHPAVFEHGGAVIVVYEQADSSVAGQWDVDLWIWKGDEHGAAAPGYPKPLATGPASTNQTSPSVATTEVDGARHLVAAWQDDRLNGLLAPLVRVLDLTTVDIDGPTYSPATAGFHVDAIAQGQYAPRVGPAGIPFLDDRGALGDAKSAVRFTRLHTDGTADTQMFFEAVNDWDDNACPVPTLDGAAWLGPARAGGPFQPYMKPLGDTARVVGVLFDPGELDSLWQDGGPVPLTQLALTGRHGATDADYDVFFYDSTVKQMVPVCTVGSSDPADRDRLSQTGLAVSWGPPPASSVVWTDARHNAPGTADADLTYKLYMASLPAVGLTANRTSLRLGASVTLTCRVRPGLPGKSVRFQKGVRYTDPLYGTTRYRGWTTLKTKVLSSTSTASWTWTPARRGTYYVRAQFAGARTSDPVIGTHQSWVPTPSRVVKVVVK